MWRLLVLALAACTSALAPKPPLATPITVPALAVEIMYVLREPAPECNAPPIDTLTRRDIVSQAFREWSAVHERNFRDYSAVTADLPTLRAAWQTRTSVLYRGVVTVYLEARRGPLILTLVEPGTSNGGRYTRHELLPSSENGPDESFGPLWSDPKTGRSLGPVHAAINVRPATGGGQHDRTRVVIYHPPHQPDILLVATKAYLDDEWTPLLRIDLRNATRFSVFGMAYPH